MIESFDVEEHYRRWKWMLGCFGVMFCFWILTWVLSPEAAVCAIVANLYFCFGMWYAVRLYPDKKEDLESLKFMHSRQDENC